MEEYEELDWLDERLASKPRKRKKKNKTNIITGPKRKKTDVPDDNHNNNFECDVCSKQFAKKEYLIKHKQVHSTQEFKCVLCPYITNIKESLNKHVRRFHERKRPVKCPYCYMMFEFQCKMEQHKLIHTGEKPHECEVCGKAFNSQYSLKTHKFIHTNEKPYQCKFCPYACRDTSTLRKHHNMHVAGTTQAYQCNVCGLKLKSKRNLKIHVAEKHLNLDVKIHPCTYCDRRFKEKSSLNIHVKAVHLKADFVNCDICSKRISRKCNLKAHMRSHDDYRQFICSIQGCHRECKTKADLKKHLIVHAEKRFPCDICGRKFARERSMQSHLIKIHGPPRPRKRHVPHHTTSYQCNSCGFLSGNKPGLIVHMKQKEQKCTVCNMTVCGLLQLNKHFLDMHTDNTDTLRDRDRDNKLEIKEEPDDTKSIDLFEIEKEEPLDDLFYAGSEVDDDDASELSEVQEAMKRIEETSLSVNLQDIPEAVFDQFYTQHVDKVLHIPNYDMEDKVHAVHEDNFDSLVPKSNLNVKVKSFIETPKIVNKRLENVKKLERNSFRQKNINRTKNASSPYKIASKNYDTNLEKIGTEHQELEKTNDLIQKSGQIIEKQKQEYNTENQVNQLEKTNKKLEDTITKEQNLNENTEEKLNENMEKVKKSPSTPNQTEHPDKTKEEVIQNSEKQINKGMVNVKTIKVYENSEPTAELHKQNQSKSNKTKPNLKINQNMTSYGKSLDPELENISKEEFADIVKLNVCNLKGIPDQLFDKFFIKHADKQVREYKYSRHNTYDPNYKSTNQLNVAPKQQNIIKTHHNSKRTNGNDNVTEEVNGQKSGKTLHHAKKTNVNRLKVHNNEESRNEVNNTDIPDTNNKAKAKIAQKRINIDKKQSSIETQETNNEIGKNIAHIGAKCTKKQTVVESVHINRRTDLDVVGNNNDELNNALSDDSKANFKSSITNDNTKQNCKVSSKTDYFESKLAYTIEPKVKTLKTLSLIKVTYLMQIPQYYQQTTYETRRKRYDYKELFNDTVSDDDDIIYFNKKTAEDNSKTNKETIYKNKKSKLSKIAKNKTNTTETENKNNTGEKSKKMSIKRKTKTSKKCKPPKETHKSKCMPNSHQCYVCFKLFDGKEALMDHSKDHFDVCNTNSLKKCPLCDYICRNGLPRHMRLVHNMEIANKYSLTKMKCKKDESGVNRYYIEGDNTDFNEIEVFPSVKNLNRTKAMKIDEKNREEKNRLIAKVKLVKKKDWVVEQERLNVEMVVPNDNMKETFTDDKEYMEKMRNLYQAAKKEGKVMMFPCRRCEKICQTLSALTLHSRKHDPNKKPFAPKVWKHKRNVGNTEVENNHDNSEKGGLVTSDKCTITSASVPENSKSAENTEAGSNNTTSVAETCKTRITEKAGSKHSKNPHNRDEKPKPIVHNHKCDPELKSFYENCIRGSDIEFWQFLKIYNKMGRENVKDFSDLDRDDNTFGCHSLKDTHVESSSIAGQEKSIISANYTDKEQRKTTKSTKAAITKNIHTETNSIENFERKKSTHSANYKGENLIKSNSAKIANKITKTALATNKSSSLKVGHANKINKSSIKSGKNSMRVVHISKKEYLKRQALKDMLRKKISKD